MGAAPLIIEGISAASPLTIWVKHSGDKPNRGRLVWVLLRKLYQKLKCSCRDRRRGYEAEQMTDRGSARGGGERK